MGLDMYLNAEFDAPEGSPLFKVIEDNLTEEHRESINRVYEDGERSSAYISGWTYGGKEPEALFTALAQHIGMVPHEGSPSWTIEKAEDGYKVSGHLFYWRKANAIHRWFVEECQNGVDECQPTVIHPEKVLGLIDACERVTVDHDLAGDLLPSQAGFFFGGTEYDEWYFRDAEETAIHLKERLTSLASNGGARLVYQSSW